MDHDIAQINYDLNRLDGATNAVARAIARIAVRIADLERDKALLLAYVTTCEDTAMDCCGEDGYVAIGRWQEARRALIDAGLLEDDDA